MRWLKLREEIESLRRAQRERSWDNAMVVQLKRAAQAGLCDKGVPHWVTRDHRMIGFLKYGDSEINGHHAITLKNLPRLEDARLTFKIVVGDNNGLRDYTVSAVGKDMASGRDWYTRIDLDPEQRGQGPCGHPILHCHVGVDAGEKGIQEARAPLPWLFPDEALAWILATLHRDLEPAQSHGQG